MADEKPLQDKARLQEEKINKLKALVIKEKKLNVELNGKLETSDKNIKQLQNENEQLISQIQRLSASVGELQETQNNESTLNDRILQLESELASNFENTANLQETLSESKTELQTVVEKLISSNAIADQLKTALSTAQKNENELYAQLAEKVTTLENIQLANHDLQTSLKDIDTQMSSNSDQLNSKLAESQTIITELEEKVNNFVGVSDRLDQLQQEKTEVSDSLNSLTSELQAVEHSRDIAQKSLENTERELLELRTVYDCTNSEKDELISRVLSLEKTLEERDLKVSELDGLVTEKVDTDSIVPSVEDCKRLEEKINSLTSYISELEQKISQVNSHEKRAVMDIGSSAGPVEEQNNGLELLNTFCTELITVIKGESHDSFDNQFLKDPTTSEFVAPIVAAVEEQLKRLSNLAETNSVLQDGMSSMSLKCTEMEELFMSSEESLSKAKKSNTEERGVFEERIKVLDSEMEANKQKLTMMEDMVEDNRNIARALEKEKDTLQVEMTELRTRTEEKEVYLTEEAREAKSALENIELQLHTINESREVEVHSLKEERQILKHEMDMLQAEIDRRDTELKDLNNEKEVLSSELEEVNTRSAGVEADLRKEIDSLNSLLGDRNQTIEGLNEKLKCLEDQMHETSSENEHKQLNENKELSASLELLQTKFSSVERELQSVEQYKAEIDSQKDLIEGHKTKHLALEEENNRLQAELDVLSQQNRNLSSTVETKEQCIVELSSTNSSIDIEILNLNQEIAELKEERSNYTEEVLKLKEKIENQVTELNEAQLLKVELLELQLAKQSETEALTNSTSEHISQIDTLKEENNNLLLRLTELENSHLVAKSEIENRYVVLQAELYSEKSEKEQLISEKESLELRLTTTKNQLQAELKDMKEYVTSKEQATTILQSDLDRAMKSARQSTVMDLELAEFEKTQTSLRDQLDAKEEQVNTLKGELRRKENQFSTLLNQMKETEQMKTQSEERANKMKQMLVKTKKELSEVQKTTTSHKSRESQITAEVETLNSQIESMKIQLTQMSSEKHKLEGRVLQAKSINDTTAKSRELMIVNLKEDIDKFKEERDLLREEFNAYKLKAHKVFKEQKPRSSLTGMSVEEIQARNERLEAAIEQIKLKLEDSEAHSAAAYNEVSVYQRDVDRLEERLKKVGLEHQIKERQWQDRFERVSIDNSAHESVSIDTIKQLSTENETLANAFRDQIAAIKQEHKESLANLRSELNSTEAEMLRLQEELWTLREYRNQMVAHQSNPVKESGGPSSSLRNNVSQQYLSTTAIMQERQQGEGMEHPLEPAGNVTPPRTGSGSVTPTYGSAHGSSTKLYYLSPIPLDQLLDSSVAYSGPASGGGISSVDNEDAASVASSSGTAQLQHHLQVQENLRQEVNSKQKRIDQLSELITDSEAMVVHLTEQAKVLKEEIRRHERNAERDQRQLTSDSTNGEYLKNIVLKFLCLNPGQERVQLIAVLSTLLSLSAQERDMLRPIAEGEKDQSPEAQGWSNYFSWAGTT